MTDGPAHKMVTRNLQPWGSDALLEALATRWQRLVPGGSELTHEQALAAAQATLMWGANPFGGQIRAWVDAQGKFVIVPGYTLIVAWANGKSPFVKRMTKITGATRGVPRKAIAYECSLLRVDVMPVFNGLTAGGMTSEAAWDICATNAIGMVRPEELFDEQGTPIESTLRNWTPDDTAQKRALMKAVRLAYGSPSIAEINAMSWTTTDGTPTDEADWQTAWQSYPDPDGNDEDRAQVASLSARTRQALDQMKSMTPEELVTHLAESNLVLHPEGPDL